MGKFSQKGGNKRKDEKGKNERKITIKFEGSEILERNVSKFGTGAHVIIPREYVGKKVKIIVEGEDEK